MARRRGKQKGYLKQEGPSWIGYWWEEVRLSDGSLDWHRASKQICHSNEVDESTRRTRAITKKEAQRRFDETILNKLEIRSLNPQSLATVREFVDLKYRPLLGFRRRKTQEHRRNMLDNHILPAIGHMQLRAVTSEHVQNLILLKTAQGKSPQTVWHIRTTITTIFKKAQAMKWFSGDIPTQGVEMPDLTRRQRIALDKDQAMLLLDRLPVTTRAMVLTLAMTGLRIGELCGLKWKRVNLTKTPIVSGPDLIEGETVAIRESWVKVHGKHLPKDQPRGQFQDVKNPENGRRDVPLIPLVVTALKRVEADTLFRAPDDPVFASRTGTPIDAHNNLARHLKPACEALRKEGHAIPPISWHDLRHTASTFADQAGVSEAERARILGHGERMNRHYTKAHAKHVRAAMEGMGEGLAQAMNPRLKLVK